jgi:hypothetical protein
MRQPLPSIGAVLVKLRRDDGYRDVSGVSERNSGILESHLATDRYLNGHKQYQYLLGYIALEAREYGRALAELLKSNLSDSFVLGLIAHAYQGKADAANAKACYAKALAFRSHSINSAFARQWARNYRKE